MCKFAEICNVHLAKMANTIRHQGVVTGVNGSHLQVKIIQTSACAACSVKGHCTSADTKEKLVEALADGTSSYEVGDKVWVTGELSMGVMAVLYAFVLPFFVILISLFTCMSLWNDELLAALCSLALLIPYYYVLWMNRTRLGRKFRFTVQPMN